MPDQSLMALQKVDRGSVTLPSDAERLAVAPGILNVTAHPSVADAEVVANIR